MVHSAFMPAPTRFNSSWVFSVVKSIRTGMRCSIFTKFPAELSWGSKEKLAPVA